jgi:ribosomal protein S18 acetylase RimI-like enzyme
MNTLKIIHTDNPTTDEINVLYQVLAQHAFEKKKLPAIKHWGFFLKDKKDTIQGSITGRLLHGYLSIDTLCISPLLRNRGHGTKLMKLAEDIGLKNACTFSTVNTMDWEAKDFYEELGYYVEFSRGGYTNNSTFYFLRKNLVND